MRPSHISYVWGSSDLADKVLCDDSSSHLPVIASLVAVLQRLAVLSSMLADRSPYWIDGLCINQDDSRERNDQVRKIADIYRRASRVRIFLGVFESEVDILCSKWFSRRWVIQEAMAALKVGLHC